MQHTHDIKLNSAGLTGRAVVGWLLVIATALGLSACSGGSEPEDTGPVGYHGMILDEPLDKPAFTLEDTSGAAFNFQEETEGYVTLLYFGYTNCPDVCPSQMAGVAAALADLPGDITDNVKVVFVSVDPERDTPERLTAWLGLFDESFIGLRGDIEEVDRIQQSALGPLSFSILRHELENGNYTVSHSALVIVYTQDGIAHIAYPDGMYKEDWASDLTQLVEKGWIES